MSRAALTMALCCGAAVGDAAPRWMDESLKAFATAYAHGDTAAAGALFAQDGGLAVPPHSGGWVANTNATAVLAQLRKAGYALDLEVTTALGPRPSAEAPGARVYHCLGKNADGAAFYVRWQQAAGEARWLIDVLVADAPAGAPAGPTGFPTRGVKDVPPEWMEDKYAAMTVVWNKKDYDAFTSYFAQGVVATRALTIFPFVESRAAFDDWFKAHGSVHCDTVIPRFALADNGAYDVIAACVVGDAKYNFYDRWVQVEGGDWQVEFEVSSLL
eukprot:TRINITY_DN21342_c0_g1_i1.p1 TRINITY_DN21342_c0_g1~~TRINITY_DN21342_c0_g1_i1.p1  ORF type:complete len:272 (+),score=91.56 TRINITY_DN21342_c0_g1_i1:52-867(+)